MKITLVRHAEVDEQYHRCYNGHIDIGLSTKGYKDAKILKYKLKSLEYEAILCSDLIRAKETLKQFIDRDDIIYTKKLREKSWGKHEGLTFEAIVAKGEIVYMDFEQWIGALGGESIETFKQRVKEFFFDYLPSLKKKNILVMTHSGVIKIFISLLKNISLQEAFSISLPYSSFVVYNSKTKELDFHD